MMRNNPTLAARQLNAFNIKIFVFPISCIEREYLPKKNGMYRRVHGLARHDIESEWRLFHFDSKPRLLEQKELSKDEVIKQILHTKRQVIQKFEDYNILNIPYMLGTTAWIHNHWLFNIRISYAEFVEKLHKVDDTSLLLMSISNIKDMEIIDYTKNYVSLDEIFKSNGEEDSSILIGDTFCQLPMSPQLVSEIRKQLIIRIGDKILYKDRECEVVTINKDQILTCQITLPRTECFLLKVKVRANIGDKIKIVLQNDTHYDKHFEVVNSSEHGVIVIGRELKFAHTHYKLLKRSRGSTSVEANAGDMIEVINNGEFYGQRFQVVTSDDTHITTRERIGYIHSSYEIVDSEPAVLPQPPTRDKSHLPEKSH